MCKKYVEDTQNMIMILKGHIAKDAQKLWERYVRNVKYAVYVIKKRTTN